MQYPVLEIVQDLKTHLSQKPVVILQAPPGAGKSTVLPLELIHESWLSGKKIMMLEPRRLAARSVAMRMASLLQEVAGETIGYRVRFENKVSSKTKIEVVTEGILTRMIQQDNSLENVGLIIFDEFHERSLHADLALALSLQIQQVLREDLKILIMSATLDGAKLSALLNDAPIITSDGRQHPVSIQYTAVDNDIPVWTKTSKAILKALREQQGDILAFLPGAGEINRTATLLAEEVNDAMIYSLYGDLPFKQQQEAILPDPGGRRKVVLATSIAETSLTIEGVTTVVDAGYSRVPKFDPRSGLTRLETIRVTKDAADQRAGRAGRLGPGVCYRLWSEAVQQNLQQHRSPEIMEADLAPLMLELYQWGLKNVNELLWLTPPPPGSVNQAKDLLEKLGATNGTQITERGKAMLKLPTHPRIAHMLIHADKESKSLAADIAALLEERDPLQKESGADITLRIESLKRWRSGERVNAERSVLERVEKLASTWRKILGVANENSASFDKEAGKLMLYAYPERLAKQTAKHSERYKLINGRIANLPSHDPLTREEWIVISQLDAGSGEGKIFQAAPIDTGDLGEFASSRRVVRWDDDREMIAGSQEDFIGNVVLRSKPLQDITVEERTKVICDIVKDRGLKIFDPSDANRNWQARVMSLKVWRPEEQWPDVTDTHLEETCIDWLAPFLINVSKLADLKRLDLHAILTAILPWELQSKLDTQAPSKLEVPSGSMISLQYFSDGRPPVMEVRLQEVFGLLETPAVNEGRNKVILHLLSPGYKPVQVTQDLKSFWTNTYAEVRKELRTRYPKHSWPEDPWTAEAVRGVKRKIS